MAASEGLDAKIEQFHWNELGLSAFSVAMAQQFVKKSCSTPAAAKQFDRVLKWLATLGRTTQSQPKASAQFGCPELIPCLRACPIWDVADIPGLQLWLDKEWQPFEAAIQSEFHALRAATVDAAGSQTVSGFQEYRSPSWSSAPSAVKGKTAGGPSKDLQPAGKVSTAHGQWNVYYLHLHNMDTAKNQARCPTLSRALSMLPSAYGHSFMSAMAPGTHITPHNGPTNKKLRMQIPLRLPYGASSAAGGEHAPSLKAGCALRVAGQVLRYDADGPPLIFDDSFEHEAWNMCTEPRVVLIADVWHPDLSALERKFLQFVRNAQLRAAKELSAAASKQGMPGADFYGILAASSSRAVDAEAVLGSE
jgi:aspartate beta-hydroxylase